MRHVLLLALLAAPLAAQDAAPAGSLPGTTPGEEDVRLADGALLRGRVLKETEDDLYVDVGFTVLQVPRGSVVGRAPAGPTDRPAGGEVRRGLWSQAELPEVSVKEAVARFAESVVQVKVPGALGSGFIVSDDGYVVTNNHVVQGETEVSVVLYPKAGDQIEKQTFEKVRLVAVNPFVDLALLKIDDEELKGRKLVKVYFGDDAAVRVGETVFAIGSPMGLERSVSEGVISTTTRAMEGRVYLQTTAAINPGNSGGPLFNTKGEVVGVNSLKIMFSDGLGFAIPVGYVKHFLDNREAFAFDRENPNSGYRYLAPPRRTAK
ncbi:MAG TPA: trypsin-like peptidase domain-containing protein [Planctomycetota bacterium]|nr:trypsin-like peptidase domain-containing protein [Planctomycetota bacterium]